MKRIVLLTVLAVMASLAIAAGNSGPKATGGVNWTSPNPIAGESHASFTAQGTIDDAKGRVLVRAATFEYKGTVTCYRQDGNEAFFSGEVTKAEGANADRDFFVINVTDNGEGEDAAPDQIRTRRFDSDPECEDLGDPQQEVEDGNLQVHPVR